MNRYIDVDKFRESINKGQIVIDEKIFECETIHDELVYLVDKVDRLIDKTIDEQPTADVVEVVRCKDCRYRRDDADFSAGHICIKRSTNGGKFCRDNDFCSYGERKENE